MWVKGEERDFFGISLVLHFLLLLFIVLANLKKFN